MGKYEDALERARKGMPMDEVFPELKESEDERIRKMLVEQMKRWKKCAEDSNVEQDVKDASAAIAYLEKQKEQKSSAEEVLIRAGLKPFKDGNQWCILVGDNIQEGVCGFGDTIDDALYEFLKGVCEQQKSAEWSDEDETCLEYALWCVTKARHFVAKDACDLDACRCAERWLNYLPERFNLPPKQEWGEEDKKMLKATLESLKRYQLSMPNYQVELQMRWLKSLRPQPHWKPSEEQMDALDNARFCKSYDRSELDLLYEQLKKL